MRPPVPPPAEDPRVLKALQDSLDAARRRRLALEAALEQQLAAGIAERARTLAMSTEVGALQKLEALLDSAQVRLLVQRDRIRLLRDATTQTEQAVLVILLRADALPPGEIGVVVLVDGQEAKQVTMNPDRARALVAGAVDELYRAEIAPVEHKVLVTIAARGMSAGETFTVTVQPRQVTYVEFALKAGKLVPTTWTNRASDF